MKLLIFIISTVLGFPPENRTSFLRNFVSSAGETHTEPSYPHIKHLCLPNYVAKSHTPVPNEICKQPEMDHIRGAHTDLVNSTLDILAAYGYPHQEHRVKTADGYVLTLHRITGSPNYKGQERETMLPVFLTHGFHGSSDWWVVQPGSRNLAFMLADAGYDVWMGNFRGSTYSLGHERLNYDRDLEYWNFSFEELGIYDVPAFIATILRKTGHSQLQYIGYSMGVTAFFVAMSELPELKSKIQSAYLLAPVVYMGHSTSPFRYFAKALYTEQAYQIFNEILGGRYKSHAELLNQLKLLSPDYCTSTAARCVLCDNYYFTFFGYNGDQMERPQLSRAYIQMFNSGSVKTYSHFGQLIASCRFQKYSYSPEKNLDLYGTIHPPEYNLKDIGVPLHLYYGNNDNLADIKDVQILVSHLEKSAIRRLYKIPDKYFNHLDFAMAKDADQLLYSIVLKDLKEFTI